MSAHSSRCPICGAEVAARSAPQRPFCSVRCKLVDLDRWLSGDYRIPGPSVDPDDPRLAAAAAADAAPGSSPTDRGSAIRDEQGT